MSELTTLARLAPNKEDIDPAIRENRFGWVQLEGVSMEAGDGSALSGSRG
jgi:hypothetical protein